MNRPTLVLTALLVSVAASAQIPDKVVVTITAPLFITPSERRDPLAVAEVGVQFNVVQVERDWYLIEYQHARWGRRVGYIHSSYVQPIFERAVRKPNPFSIEASKVAAAPPQRTATAPSMSPPPGRAGVQRGQAGKRAISPNPTIAQPTGTPIKLTGYLEWRRDGYLVVDGQRVRWKRDTRFKLRKPLTIDTVRLGEEVEVSGVRLVDGSVLARTFEAKPNGVALFEAEVRAYSNIAESTYVEKGAFLQLSPGGNVRSLGTVIKAGPEVERCNTIVAKLLPPTTSRAEVRVYVIDSPDWNAMVMPNGAMWVFRGLLRDMDDDEVAAVIPPS